MQAPLLQQTTAEQCYRFINSELYFKKADVNSTLRALHNNPMPKREISILLVIILEYSLDFRKYFSMK